MSPYHRPADENPYESPRAIEGPIPEEPAGGNRRVPFVATLVGSTAAASVFSIVFFPIVFGLLVAMESGILPEDWVFYGMMLAAAAGLVAAWWIRYAIERNWYPD